MYCTYQIHIAEVFEKEYINTKKIACRNSSLERIMNEWLLPDSR